jgi:aminoglycoside 6'-N-acetyltransferase I
LNAGRAITIRHVTPSDSTAWLDLRCALWPAGSRAEHGREIAQFFAGRLAEPLAVLLAVGPAGRVVGLAELSIRPSAEGCRTPNVAYLEGWFVDAALRRQGVGRALIGAAEAWARSVGCQEFASDIEPGNAASIAAHRALGFEQVGALAFRKDLYSGAPA